MIAHAETLTQGEMARAVIERTNPLWHMPMDTLTEPNRTVLFLLAGGTVVEGWMSRHFERALGRVTYWTWDPAFCTVSQFLSGVAPVVMAGCVEPVAWAPLPGASVAQCQPRLPTRGEQRA